MFAHRLSPPPPPFPSLSSLYFPKQRACSQANFNSTEVPLRVLTVLFVVSSKMSCKNWKGRVQRIWKWYLPICIIPSQCYQPGDSRFWTVSPGLQITVWNLPDNRRKFAISCRLDFLTMKFQIFCVAWIIIILMLTLNVSSQTPVCNFDISNNVICVTTNIRDDRIQRVFFAQMTSSIIPSL